MKKLFCVFKIFGDKNDINNCTTTYFYFKQNWF